MTSDTLTITDNRTGKTFDLPIENGTIPAMALRAIKVDDDDFGVMTYDAAFKNTASCKSTITYIDGEKGILEYRGYPIGDLASKSSHLESSYLILNGDLPTKAQLAEFEADVEGEMVIHQSVLDIIKATPRDAHPMAMLQTAIAGLGALNGTGWKIKDADARAKHINRIIGQIAPIAANCFRHSKGLPFLQARSDLSYTENFVAMIMSPGDILETPNATLAKAMDVLFVLHIDHEQNCSTTTMRAIGSSEVNPYAALAGAIAALYGPLHGGANEKVLKMLREIGSAENIPEFINKAKNKEVKLMGFGHRVYKNYDPRASEIRVLAAEVFKSVGRNPLIDIAVGLEKSALEDSYFADRKLFPNVDFYSGIIYEVMGFPTDYFTVLFAIARTVGWVSQWQEMLLDDDQKIARPRQIYLGEHERSYTDIESR